MIYSQIPLGSRIVFRIQGSKTFASGEGLLVENSLKWYSIYLEVLRCKDGTIQHNLGIKKWLKNQVLIIDKIEIPLDELLTSPNKAVRQIGLMLLKN